jgi:hypothetical protein
MQASILLYGVHLDQFDESGKGGFGMHHLEDGIVFVMAAIVQQKRCYDVKCGVVFFLLACQQLLTIGGRSPHT